MHQRLDAGDRRNAAEGLDPIFQTTDLGVRGSNPFGRANPFNRLANSRYLEARCLGSNQVALALKTGPGRLYRARR